MNLPTNHPAYPALTSASERAAARLKSGESTAELAAEQLLVAAGVLLRATQRRKPSPAARHLNQMLRQLPAIAVALPGPDLETHCRALAAAYETGNEVAAGDANTWIESFLKPLCY